MRMARRAAPADVDRRRVAHGEAADGPDRGARGFRNSGLIRMCDINRRIPPSGLIT